MKILCFLRGIVEKITKKNCGRCKHCLEGISCDNFQRYYKCASSIYPKMFEPKENIKEKINMESKTNFNIGDRVCAGDWIEGIIVNIENDIASVEFETAGGGGCLPFELNELIHVPIRIATLRATKSAHGTVNVMIQNCSREVVTLLSRFDVWKSNGRYEYDKNNTNERAKIWFECPMEFLDFIESSMGSAAFERMGVEEFYIEH